MIEELGITFIDVGQGDSTLIRLPTYSGIEGGAILIDCPSGKSQTILDLLKEHSINHLALVIVTHSDDDHCGGISDILSHFANLGTIDQVAYIPDSPSNAGQRRVSRAYRRFTRLTLDLEQQGKLRWWKPNLDSKNYGDVVINFLHPDERDSWRGLAEQDRNSVSQVVLLEFFGTKVLFAADITEKGWSWIMNRMNSRGLDASIVLKSRVIKVPHHGGAWKNIASLKSLFDLTQPEYVIISTGSENTYNHPSQSLFDIMRSVPSIKRILCTQATPHRCGLKDGESFSCAGSVELILQSTTFTIFPNQDQHLIRIKLKHLHPACSIWLPKID